jgi:uncharacterized protein (DUF39 family)
MGASVVSMNAVGQRCAVLSNERPVRTAMPRPPIPTQRLSASAAGTSSPTTNAPTLARVVIATRAARGVSRGAVRF